MLEAIRATLAGMDGYEFTALLRRRWQAPDLTAPYRQRRFLLTDLKPAQWLQEEYFARRFSSLWAIGADIIDGAYDEYHAVKLLTLLRRAAARGATAGIFGSSISTAPKDAPMRILAQCPEIRFRARDPISRERFEQRSGRPADLVADVAFLLKPALTSPTARDAASWIGRQKAAGRRILAANASDFTMKSLPPEATEAQRDHYQRWLANSPDRSLLLFPHDFRPFPVGDITTVSSLYKSLRGAFDDRVFMLSPPFNAWDVKAILAIVDGAVVARMHAAIAALGAGLPPLCIVYKGKFEGLMQHFGLDGLCLRPALLLDGQVFSEKLREYETRMPALKAQVSTRLPQIDTLARKNFERL